MKINYYSSDDELQKEFGNRIKSVRIDMEMTQGECFTISDKARCVAGSVLEAVMVWENKRPKRRFFGRG